MIKYRFLRFPEGKIKAVTLSYDDGAIYDEKLVEIIDRYKLKCTFNICSGFMSDSDGEYFLTADKLKEILIPGGHEIAVHGEYHRALGKQSALDGIKDILNCRLGLEKAFGGVIRGLAYADSGISSFTPGTDYETVRSYLSDLGIAYGRIADRDNNRFDLPTDWYRWAPTAHHANPEINSYIDNFVSYTEEGVYMDSKTPKLFYLWGHSFEFEKTNTWGDFENICSKLGGRDDVWYATNIEIYDYVNAYNSLVFSADGETVFNPTAYKIWFALDKRTFCAEPGATTKLDLKK